MKKLLFALTMAFLTNASFAADMPASMKPVVPAEPGIESAAAAVTPTGIQVGAPAPDFKVYDINNVAVNLEDMKGKNIVLEWYNKDCPFSRKHYDSRNMQGLQAQAKKQDIVWLTIASSAKGKQGHMTQDEAKENFTKEGMESAYFIIDEDGSLGKLYHAKTTPHMFVINKAGNIAYIGAIDNKPSADVKDIKGALNYVKSAMNALYHDAKIGTEVTQPYGCSVKYAD